MQRARSTMGILLPDLSPPPDAAPTAFINTVGHTLLPLGAVATLVGLLPTVLGVLVTSLGAIFYSIQIYESSTFRHWRMNHIMRKKARKLARLRAKERIVVAKIEALQTLKDARIEATSIMSTAKAEAAKVEAHTPVAIAEKQNPTI